MAGLELLEFPGPKLVSDVLLGLLGFQYDYWLVWVWIMPELVFEEFTRCF